MRTVVIFHSAAFNITEAKDYFINECCFGDDLCKWLIKEFRARGLETDDAPGQEDFGWFFNFESTEGSYCLVTTYRPGDDNEEGVWICWMERGCGLLASMLGGRKTGISQDTVELLHQVLKGSPAIKNILWHRREDFDKGRGDLGSPIP